MEDNTVTTVNEQLEILEESNEDSSQGVTETQNTQVNPETAVDEDLREAPDDIEKTGSSEDATSESDASTGNLIEEWGYLNKPIIPTD